MKQGLMLAILAAASFFGSIFGFPFWFIFLLLPLAAYGQLFTMNQYMFRESLDFEPIPIEKYPLHLSQLEANQQKFSQLGFVKFDEFLLRPSIDVVTFVYEHQTEPIYLCNYHFGQLEVFDLITEFEGGFTLTTADSKNSGNSPHPDNKLLQIFDRRPVEELAYYHYQAIQFLQTQGLTPIPSSPEIFRYSFLKAYFEAGEKMKGLLAPAKMIYWMASGVNKKYCKTIQQQYLAKQFLLQ